MIGIDDGNGITRCDDNSLRFEGYDDYCICGDASDKIGGSDQNCDDVCDTITKECLLGIDEGRNAKKCTDEIDFDDSYDYCICGDVSQRVVPGPLPINDRECKDVCPGGMESCMIGIDDGNDIRKCNEDFDFEAGQTDDYCICGDDSEKVVPIPT
jgi:hypothetical protein